MSPKDFFLHLGVVISLYIEAISFINLLFVIIDKVFPGELQRFISVSSISWPIASLIIIFPLFILLSWLLNKEYRLNPPKRELGIRKWLIFITLFVAGVAIVVDLIVLIFTYLNGELITLGFVLKVLTVFVVAAAIFWYYLRDLKNQFSVRGNKTLALVAGLIILAAIVAGFVFIGSPRTQRLTRVDSQKVSDLQSIQWRVVNFWQTKSHLPATIAELEDSISGFTVPTDPEEGKKYSYETTGTFSFKLCADFNLSSQVGDKLQSRPVAVGYGLESENWQHDKGVFCFSRTIDPELYPPRKN